MEIRAANDEDTAAVVALLREADDARVLSEEGLQQMRKSRPERGKLLDLVAVDDGRVVACGAAGLNLMTSEPGAAWAFVTVASDRRGEGIGTAVGEALLEHLRSVGALKVTSFIRHTDEGERWATARGWSRVLGGPLIALDPRDVPAPEPPDGFVCARMGDVSPRALYEAVCEAALDEPAATTNDSIEFDEFLLELENPDTDLASSAVVLDGDDVAAFAFLKVAGARAQHVFTGTRRAYRGRGLATAAKRFALRALAEKGVTRITTSNAEENAAMRAINRRLGFEQIGEHVILARDL